VFPERVLGAVHFAEAIEGVWTSTATSTSSSTCAYTYTYTYTHTYTYTYSYTFDLTFALCPLTFDLRRSPSHRLSILAVVRPGAVDAVHRKVLGNAAPIEGRLGQ
jgi:hypothetical protein